MFANLSKCHDIFDIQFCDIHSVIIRIPFVVSILDNFALLLVQSDHIVHLLLDNWRYCHKKFISQALSLLAKVIHTHKCGNNNELIIIKIIMVRSPGSVFECQCSRSENEWKPQLVTSIQRVNRQYNQNCSIRSAGLSWALYRNN